MRALGKKWGAQGLPPGALGDGLWRRQLRSRVPKGVTCALGVFSDATERVMIFAEAKARKAAGTS